MINLNKFNYSSSRPKVFATADHNNLPGTPADTDQPGPSGNNSIIVQNDDEPGPSGIDLQKIEKTDGVKPKIEVNQEPTKVINPIQQFTENVSIVGLHESYKEECLAIKCMFIIALILATCMIVYQAVAIVIQYQYQTTMYLDKDINDQAPFPSVTVCFPQVTNEIPFPDLSALSKRDAAFMIRHNLSMRDVDNFVKGLFYFERKVTDLSTPLYAITKKLFDEMLQSFSKDKRNLVKEFSIPPCSHIFSNCAFADQQFDCCEEAKFLILPPFSCFEIRVNRNISKPEKRDPIRLEKIGLTFDVSKDWTSGEFQDGIASDGFHIFINTLPSMFSVPVHVPSDMSVLVSLGQPKRISKITQCFRPDQIPKLKYYDTYDPYGFHCAAETLLDMDESFIGCLIPLLDYFPAANRTCSFAQFFAIGLALVGGNVDDSSDKLMETMKKHTEKLIRSFTVLLTDQSPCKPLCTLWTHPVFSASYGSIQYRDKKEEKRQLANRSWSRIRIILPDQSYISRQEIVVDAKYLVMCKIGSVMSAYAGFSVITFAEILFYGAYIIWFRRQRIRIRPKPRINQIAGKTNLKINNTSTF